MSLSLDSAIESQSDELLVAEGFWERGAKIAFQAASFLTDPICKVRECYWRIYTVDDLNGASSEVANFARKFFLAVSILGWGALSIGATPLGVFFRAVAIQLSGESFLYEENPDANKILPSDQKVTLLSLNICCMPGGYSISDGGVVPLEERLAGLAELILQTDADLVCLYEAFDAKASFYLKERLKEAGYSVYYNIGPQAVGVSSGMLVASRYKMANPEFTPFPKDTLVGRTKYAEKGVFSFELKSQGASFGKVFSTHLQHSEEPAFPVRDFEHPENDEVLAREKQMRILLEKAEKVQNLGVILTGDLNFDDQEHERSFWRPFFQKEEDYQGKMSWGGDASCARWTFGKRISGPLNLDHTFVFNHTVRSIHTTLIDTKYNPKKFTQEALSDHLGLFSAIFF